MRIAIHDHDANSHKLYDSSSNELSELGEDMATQVHVGANAHLVKATGRWILEVSRPTKRTQDRKWRTEFDIDADDEEGALERAKQIIDEVE